MHKVIEPKILYFGTPVVLISTLNEDGSTNLAPISSAWWLGQSCMLGMSTRSKTVQNLQRNGECVLNLPSADLVNNVNRLALKTGKNPIPEYKEKMGYTYESEKFKLADFTETRSDIVKPSRVTECRVQLEGVVENIHNFGPKDDCLAGIEVKIIRVHVDESLIMDDTTDHIDPDKWDPLIMSFTEFYGLREKLRSSRLAEAFRPLLTN
ncbi:MAG: flavin reductase family protein [Candidatus Heimdallarchaeota archaeon]|nr:flavin reductase family protein [Candidatus Heimdallarchaeota archaeon]